MEMTDHEFNDFSNYIRSNFGINLTDKKRTLLTSRLNMVLENGNFGSFSDYFNHVISDRTGQAVNELVDKVTTNHTFFYREKQHYEYLTKEVLPYFINENQQSKDLRLWSAGCSTGEEPYSIAMVMADYLGNQRILWDTKILATDISNHALTKAKRGIYTNENIKNNPPIWNKLYFRPYDKDNSIIVDSIKREVIFRRFNLLSQFTFKKQFHVIFCRNVMIYFDMETKMDIVEKFYQMLEPGGYLFIGHSESIDKSSTRFKYIKPSVYRKD